MHDNHFSTEEPREDSHYQTGRTSPPKSRRGLLSFLLVVVIALGGIISVLSFLNIQLFRQLQEEQNREDAFCFSQEELTSSASTETVPAPDPVHSDSSVQIQLQQSPESVENIPQEGGLSLQQIYASAIDSVVSVSCVSRGSTTSGTGVVISRDGYIVTNAHVVEDAVSLEILMNDGCSVPAVLVGADAVSDLAVLYVEHTDLQPAQFGDSAALRVGDSVVAIGDPLGSSLRGTMTNGIVSAINRDITTGGRTMTLIQTNAALNSGNSGGPLLNCYGQVVGINTMKIGDYMDIAGVEGLGFAIPSTTVKEVVDQLLQQGYVSGRPSLGFSGSPVTAFDQLYYRLPAGIYIAQVDAASDAAAKGILPGDILLELDGSRVVSEEELQALLGSHNAGDAVSAVIYRQGARYSVRFTLEEDQQEGGSL